MTNAAKRSLSLNGSIFKYVLIFFLFILVLDFQLATVSAALANARPAHRKIVHKHKNSGAKPRHQAKKHVNITEEDDEDGEVYEEDEEDDYEDTDYEELEFKPIGDERDNPWESYMEKFNIPKVHGIRDTFI